MQKNIRGLVSTASVRNAMLAVALAILAQAGVVANAQIRDPLEVQKGREEKLLKRGAAKYYSEQWNLDDLPEYQPQQQVSGVIRQWGSNYFQQGGLGKAWEEGFRKHQPNIKFADDLKTTLSAIPGLTFGLSDIGPSRKITSDETLLFQRYHNHFPTEITVVTGSLNVPGWSYALSIMVNKDNPLTRLSIEQLDGIFGAERSGAFKGTEWDTSVARGADKNIRTWGQLGLTGEWADKPINVYGYNIVGRDAFAQVVRANSIGGFLDDMHRTQREMAQAEADGDAHDFTTAGSRRRARS
jgi:phosphate transport system substrate-binding protein